MKRVFFVLAAFMLVACSNVKESTRILSEVSAGEFNSLASGYLVRPTVVEVRKMGNDDLYLYVHMSTFGGAERALSFSRSSVSNYVALIDKYLSWESLAASRKDSFTKEIGRARAWRGDMGSRLVFGFRSDTAANHYLNVSLCYVGGCNNSMFFDRVNALKLRELLLDFDSGKVAQRDLSAIYK